MFDQLKNKIIDLEQWARNPDIQVLKYDTRTTEYFYRQSDVEGFSITDCQYLLYLNKLLCDVHYKIFSEKRPLSIDTAIKATVYTPSADIYRFNSRSIKRSAGVLSKLEDIYKAQAPQRTGDRAIDGDAILQAYDIASRNPICKSGAGARAYGAGGSRERVWLDTSCKKQSGGVEYGTQKHLFTPAEYEIVSQMRRRKFMDDEREW